MVTDLERWSTSLPAKAAHAQLDTIAHQVVIQRAYIRNNLCSQQNRKGPPTGNTIDRLALPPRILTARRTTDNVDHGPRMVAFHNETDAAHYRTYGVSFGGGPLLRQGLHRNVEGQQIPQLSRTHTTDCSCSRKPGCVHYASTDNTLT